ncbi:VOC family protein [Actinomadura sp. WAC 06369]|uniref:VOC family protein n=1 Tax=Actinomadura sp. WAC 06369 TaxID=2203193 RepID=UPI000F7803ED|nr:VOC family protein [Actinomadura sp. WAC 06369]RSN67576.1 bleomycin resistance protein [Actinomadura sp. WAC 06369]
MALSIDIITLGVPEVEAAQGFYASAFSCPAPGEGPAAGLDLHGTGRLAFQPLEAMAGDTGADPAASGFRGYVLSSIVQRPAEVRALLDAAAARGATVVKPAKKALFGEFTAAYQAPDGAVWKLAAATKKDTAPVPDPPEPTETAVYLGVAKPKASKTFYEKLGMKAEHDYGDKFIDFAVAGGACRLGLLTRKALAGDVGIDQHGDGFSGLVLTHTVASPGEVDALLDAARSAGAQVTAPTDQGEYAGHFTDPDGHHWKITARP